MPIHPGSHFVWEGRTGTAFASDLPEHFASRIWNDSCDVGFFVRSERTGAVKLFVRESMIKNAEGEVVGDEYVSESGKNASDRITVKVFNT